MATKKKVHNQWIVSYKDENGEWQHSTIVEKDGPKGSMIASKKADALLKEFEEIEFKNLFKTITDIQPDEYMCRGSRKSYLYLIKIDNSTLYKIGITSDVASRFLNLQSTIPLKLKLLAYRRSQKAPLLEALLHHKFDKQRGMGEWFNFKDEPESDVIKQFHNAESELPSIPPLWKRQSKAEPINIFAAIEGNTAYATI